MTPHDARLAPAAGAAWLAAASAWLEWGWWPLGAAALVLAMGTLRNGARPAMLLASIAGCAGGLAGLAAASAEAPVRAAVGETVELAVVATADAAPGVAGPTQGLWRVEVAVSAVDGVAVRARVVVWGEDEWSSVVRGHTLVVAGRLSQADGGAAALMWRPVLGARHGPHGLDALVAGAREGLRNVTEGLPERLRPLVRGMAIGDDSGMTPLQRGQMATAGLAHLTAVSGSHFAIVLITVTLALRTVVRSRRVVAAVTGAAMMLLVCLVFPEPSVMRAATMAGAICAALWWGRPAQALPALCAGITIVAITDPRLACEPGFAMSVSAVAAIALWAPALAARLGRVVPRQLAEPLAVCLAAQSAVLPMLAMIGGGVGPWSVLANLAVGWCAAPVTLLGLAAVLATPASPAVGEALAWLAAWCAWPVDAAARAADHLPGAGISVPPGAWGAAASGLVVAVAVALTFAARLRLAATALVGAAVLGLLGTVTIPRLTVPSAPGDWLVVACDVGQGDGMLLRSGPDSAVMVDVGPEGGAGRRCLDRYGVRRIDLLVITHPHADHVGGLAEVLAKVPVAEVWLPAEQAGETATQLAQSGTPVVEVRDGHSRVVGGVSLMVLGPRAASADHDSTSLNDASVVTLATVTGVTVLGLGDLEYEGQRELAARLSPAVVDVVKVPHHGSDRQEPRLAELVTARLGVVSVGADNTYGHPAPDAMELWGARATVTLRTDLCGDIVVTPGPALATSCPTDVAG